MKSYVIILLLCCVTFLMGFALATTRNKPSAAQTPPSVRDSEAQAPAPTPPPKTYVSETPPAPSAPAIPAEPPPPATTAPPTNSPVAATPSLPPALKQAIDTLLSPQSTFHQKQAAWKSINETGQLDQAIEALKQGAAQNPTNSQWLAELGQANLQKAGALSRSGASINELGILGMQADQNFDSALKVDPSNWDAQFFKAVAMAHWPAELNKGAEVVQMLSRLIDQQETLPPQPQFAATYAVLGEQYMKMGQADYAQQTWQLGLQKFPADATLQKKVAGQ